MKRNEAIRIISQHEYQLLSEEQKINICVDFWYVYEELTFELSEQTRYYLINNEPETFLKYTDDLEDLVLFGLQEKCKYFNNHYLSKKVSKLIGSIVSVSGNEKDGLVRCPLCGFFTLSNESSYEVCKVCKWEDDGSNLLDKNKYSHCNHSSFNFYKKNFLSKVDITKLTSKFIN